jgi:Domain of unknown function (DUF4326)
MPRRIVRRRIKGWRKPEGAIDCTRANNGPWGNRYVVGQTVQHVNGRHYTVVDRAHAVALYREWLFWQLERFPHYLDDLKGRDLMCWCPFGQPCHVDVLLEVANATDRSSL